MTSPAPDPAGDDREVGRAVAAALGLEPLPMEGGLFRRTYTGSNVTAILFLLVGDDVSAVHRLTSDEVYFHHAGAPLRMLLIDRDARAHEVTLGSDVLGGQHPQFLVPAGWWQGSSADGAWSLVSTVVTPGFDWADFELRRSGCPAALVPGGHRSHLRPHSGRVLG